MDRTPRESRIGVNGIEIALWEWPGAGPPVLLCHATSFHARCWDQVIARLPGRHCYAYDARGHGRSSKPAPPYRWRHFGHDAAAIAEALGLSGAFGVGHSVGGHAVTLASALRPGTFAALLLVDPMIQSKERYTGPWHRAQFAAKRRNHWASPQAMFESFRDRPPFNTWDPAVLHDYCEYGLLPNGDGFVLACPPAIEASIYENGSAVDSNIYAEVATVQIPVRIVRAGKLPEPGNAMGTSPVPPDLAASFARGADLVLPQCSHLIPMEAPSLTATLIAELFSSH